MTVPRFRFINVVWGQAFTDAFLRVCLPSQLTPANLPVFGGDSAEYWIYTTRRDAEIIRQSSAYRALSALMRVRLFDIDGVGRIGKYQAMNQCHRHFIQAAADAETSLVFQTPDIVWGDGAFRRIRELRLAGVRHIAIGSIRLNKESFLPALLERHGRDGVLQRVTARELAGLALGHLHPATQAQTWSDANRSSFPQGELVFTVGKEGILLRKFRLQPLMVTPEDRQLVPAITFDADYTDNLTSDPGQWYIVQDSDDMCYVDFTSEGYARSYGDDRIRTTPPTVEAEAEWARVGAYRMHRYFVTHSIRMHAVDCSSAWKDAEARASEVVRQVMARLEASDRSDFAIVPSPLRFTRPSYLWAKIRQFGLPAFAREAASRSVRGLARRLRGSQIRVSALD